MHEKANVASLERRLIVINYQAEPLPQLYK